GTLCSTGATTTVVHLFYGTNDGGNVISAWDTSVVAGTNGSLYSLNVTGLAEGVRIYYRYYATNPAGASWALRSQDFVVPGSPIPVDDSVLPLFGVGRARVDARYANLNRGDIRIFYGPNDGGTNIGSWLHAESLGPIDTRAFSAELTGLIYGIETHVRIYASNAYGAAWSSGTLSFKPLPPQIPTNAGLWVRQFDNESGPDEWAPVSVLQNKTEELRSIQTAAIDYADNFSPSFGGISANDSLALLWEGYFLPTNGAGTYSFGLDSDDSSVWAFDLDHDGDYDDGALYDPGERILDRPCCGTSNTTVALNHRAYRTAIGFEQGGGAGRVRAGWANGTESQFSNLVSVSAASGVFYGDLIDLVQIVPEPVTLLTPTTAVIHATVRSPNALLDVRAYWGTNDAGTNVVAWSNLSFVGTASNTASVILSLPVGTLLSNTVYYYSFSATNCSGVHWPIASSRFRTPSGPLAIDNGTGVSDLLPGSATLNGTLTRGGQADVTIYWGRSDGGSIKTAWDASVDLGTLQEGAFSTLVTGTLFGALYYYRCYTTNAFGQAWATSSVAFKTANPGFARQNGLLARQFDFISGQFLVNPIGNLMNQPGQGVSVQTTAINYNNVAANLPFITDNNTFAVLWEGWFRPPAGAGIYTFGLNHEDKAAMVIDLNGNGQFDNGAVYEPGELVVDGAATFAGCCGTELRSLVLEDRDYRFAIGFEQGGGPHIIQAGWGLAGANSFAALNPIDGSSTAFKGDHPVGPVGVENQPASSILTASAVMHAQLFAADALYGVTAFYGPSDGGTNPFAWSNAVPLGVFSNLQSGLSVMATNLVEDTVYYYSFRATNCATEVWGGDSVMFSTDLIPSDFSNHTTLAFCGYDRSETLTNFPVLIVFNESITGFDYRQFDSPPSADLRFAEGSDVLYYEIESWNTNGNSYLWVQVPALVPGHTVMTAYWGRASASTSPVYTVNGAVWSEGYEGVWHLDESPPNGGVHFDRTANGFDGVLV
ncbi:MAG: hypothetical protein AAF492_05335, partial [Verrucomicrobiota bacterium]